MYVTGKRKGIAALFLLVILTAGMAFPALAAETEACPQLQLHCPD